MTDTGGDFGPTTRRRFEYQDHCAALVVLCHFRSGSGLAGILLEHATDLALIPVSGSVEPTELVSIKHREPNQSGSAAWTWTALKNERVLDHLLKQWRLQPHCNVALYTNAGFQRGPAHELWRACSTPRSDRTDVSLQVAAMLGIETEEALLFIKALSLPRTPLPQRAHIEAVGMALLRDILLDADAPTEQVPERYEALVAAIAAASKVESTSTSPAATLHGLIESGPSATLSDRYLDVERLASVLDLAPSGAAGDIPALVPSRSFVGRRELLDELWELLHPDVGDRVVPVALSGLGGIGKTSLAVQFAALYSDEFRTVILDGSDRSLLVEGLSRAGVEVPDPSGGVLTAVASAFPGGPRTLWLIDGVRTLEAIRGLVPGENEARIIITTTSAAVAATFRKLEVTHWQPNESISYIRDALPTSSPDEAAQLAACLHHIPLAICQAVAVCGVTQRTIPGYLELLASQPASTLGLAVSRSDRTVLTTTMLSVDTVRQQMPLAVDLLRLLAHMGSAATPEVMLQNWSAVVWLPDEPRLFPADPEALAEVSPFAEMVGDPVQRTQAIALLVDAALLTIRNHDLSVHPLIQHIVRERCVGDVHPLLHVGIGLFWESDPENGIKPTMIREGTQLLSLLELAHREGVSGPALHLQESSVAEWLVTMGRYEEAREFADRALTWARSIPSTEPLQRSNLCYFRLSAAKTRYACGDPDAAMNLLGETGTTSEMSLTLGSPLPPSTISGATSQTRMTLPCDPTCSASSRRRLNARHSRRTLRSVSSRRERD